MNRFKLRASFDDGSITFHWRIGSGAWNAIDPVFDAGRLSADDGNGFTGTYVGMSPSFITQNDWF